MRAKRGLFRRALRARAGIMAQGESPKNPGEKKRDRSCDHEMQHQPGRLIERLDQEPRGNVRHDHDRNDPAENEAEKARENHVGIARDVEEIEVAIDEPLRPDDPETDRGQREHDRVMDRHAEAEGHQIKRDQAEARDDLQLRQRDDHDDAAEDRVQHAVESELFRGNGELAVDREDEERIEPTGADQLRDVGDIDEEKRLEQLRDHLVGPDEEDDFPLRPITDVIDLPEDDPEENDLAAEPEHFHDHPKNEVHLETQLADERVAQHDSPDLEVAAHGVPSGRVAN